MMLQRFREFLTLILLAVLPLHALLVTFGTKIIQGPWHPPMTTLALWKEGMLGVILLLAMIEMLPHFKKILRFDLFDVLILLLLLVAVIIPSSNFAFGFKYDFIPLIAFLILRRASWSSTFFGRAQSVLLIMGGVIAAYGIITFFFPFKFFTELGYSDGHSLYSPNSPLAAFQQISGSSIRRIQSTMSGPNQFGMWLLIPISIALSTFLRGRKKEKIRMGALLCLLLLALALTFSRSAWIATFVVASVAASSLIPRKIFVSTVAGALGIFMIIAAVISLSVPSIFVRKSSLIEHINRPIVALRIMKAHPLGLGLGAAGPAANRISEACVYLDAGADASWAKNNPELCVFVAGKQVQPADHDCQCAFLPENWYLQIGVELGILGFILYGMLIVAIIWRLRITDYELRNSAIRNPQFAIFLLFLGISIAGLFLHAWEDAAVAYTAWVCVALATPLPHRKCP